MVNQRIDGVPVIFEHEVTALFRDAPVTYNYYSVEKTAEVLKNLKSLGKKFIHKVSIYNLH
jgi:hypothetical protein